MRQHRIYIYVKSYVYGQASNCFAWPSGSSRHTGVSVIATAIEPLGGQYCDTLHILHQVYKEGDRRCVAKHQPVVTNMAPLHVYASFYASLFKSLCALVFARLYTPQPVSKRDLSGHNAIVTGGNSGIGLSIATQLARQGATVHLACRSFERGEKAIHEIISKVGEDCERRIHCWQVDTSDLSSVRAFCERWIQKGKTIDILVHNAGIASPPSNSPSRTKDGKDLVIVTNFLGSFLMTCLLEPCLTKTARIVMTSSTGHYSATTFLQPRHAASPGLFSNVKTYVFMKLGLTPSSAPAYAHSKAQQVLFATLLQQHFSSTGSQRSAHSFTPGFTSSPIFSKFDVDWRTWISNPFFAVLKATQRYVAVDTDEGAKTGAWLAAEGNERSGGEYWEWCTRRTSLVDFMRGIMDEEMFAKRSREEWTRWERDTGMEWRMEI
jgi:NAD(P)-dependent dehydrogenase (short-subunit alcohol dehydrogenase family)